MGNEVSAPILHEYFAFVFEQGVFPHILTMAKVVPIFKSGNRNFTSNYRPVSLSKVLEKLVNNCLICFFDKHSILYNYQYGFREKHSVLHALLDVTSLGYDAIQSKKHSAFLFMELRKLSTQFPTKYCFKNYLIMVYVDQLINLLKITFIQGNNLSL